MLTQQTLTRGKVQLSYLDSGGSAPLVVFIHGLAGSSKEFIASARTLQATHRVVLLDQRGHGNSARFPADVSRAAFVDDVVGLLEKLAPAKSVTLVGQSMGGHTALLTAAARPDLISDLVLLETTVHGNPDETSSQIGEYFRSWPLPFSTRDVAEQFLGSTALGRAWVADLEQVSSAWRPRFDPEILEKVAVGMQEPQWQAWKAVQARTLAIFAENGMFTAQQKNDFIDARPQTSRVDIQGASHDAHLDSFDFWTRTLKRFVSGKNPR